MWSTGELSLFSTQTPEAPFKIIHVLIRVQSLKPKLGRYGNACRSLPMPPGSPTEHLTEAAMLPRDEAQSETESLTAVLQTTGLYFNSLRGLEYNQGLTAVSADLSCAHPWLYTSRKCRWRSSWEYRVTNHHLHTTPITPQSHSIDLFSCIINNLCGNTGKI